MGRFRGALAALAVLATCAGLAGCASPPPEPPATSIPTAAPTAAGPTPSPTYSAAAPQFDPDGSARSNLDYFDAVNRKLFAAKAGATGRAIVDNLARAGFDKSAMQVTPDRTPIGNRTDSIEFSVRLDAQCLIGQSSGGSYTSLVAPALADGACLVGKTRPIDW